MHRRSLVPFLLGLAALLGPRSSAAAPPLVPGDIVVAGYSYEGEPAGACDGRICIVDSAMTSVTPISDAVPTGVGVISDLAVEGPGSVVAIASIGGAAGGTLLRVNVASGAIAVASTGIPAPREASVAVARGRVFVAGSGGVHEVSPVNGEVTLFASGSYFGLDAEAGGGALQTMRTQSCFPLGTCMEFVRIPLTSGVAIPLGELLTDIPGEFDIAPDGSRFAFARVGNFGDGMVLHRTSTGTTVALAANNEAYQNALAAVAADLDGSILLAGDGHPNPENPFRLVELERRQPLPAPNFQVLAAFDADFGISALDVTPPRACADGIDNDADGTIDWDGGGIAAPDPSCAGSPLRNSEQSGGCGLGAELVILLAWVRRSVALRR